MILMVLGINTHQMFFFLCRSFSISFFLKKKKEIGRNVNITSLEAFQASSLRNAILVPSQC